MPDLTMTKGVECRLLYRGKQVWVGGLSTVEQCLPYIQAGVAAGNDRADYQIEKREVVTITSAWKEVQ